MNYFYKTQKSLCFISNFIQHSYIARLFRNSSIFYKNLIVLVFSYLRKHKMYKKAASYLWWSTVNSDPQLSRGSAVLLLSWLQTW